MWTGVDLDPAFLDKEDLIAKLHFVGQLERLQPYGPANGRPLFDRVGDALSRLPRDLQGFALAVYANAVYLPAPLLHTSWSYLANEAATKLGVSVTEFIADALFLEVDPSGLVPVFMHENRVPGRLDVDKFSRFQTVEDVANALLLLGSHAADELNCATALRTAFAKRYWVLLTDNALSGTSLSSDLARMGELIRAFAGDQPPTLVVLAQVLTTDAKTAVVENFDSGVILKRGLCLDERFKVEPGNRECRLFRDAETLEGVCRLSEWLATQDWFADDPDLAATKARSQDDLRFGFKGCGLTVVTPNCPTNSLPLLWYQNPGFYSGPFPRIMSRTTQAKGSGGPLLRAVLAQADSLRMLLSTEMGADCEC